jgi:hypothetical protein
VNPVESAPRRHCRPESVSSQRASQCRSAARLRLASSTATADRLAIPTTDRAAPVAATREVSPTVGAHAGRGFDVGDWSPAVATNVDASPASPGGRDDGSRPSASSAHVDPPQRTGSTRGSGPSAVLTLDRERGGSVPGAMFRHLQSICQST